MISVGPGLGAVVAPPLIVWLTVSWGWREAFIVSGAIGFLWLVAWVRLYDSPATYTGISSEETRFMGDGKTKADEGVAPRWGSHAGALLFG